MKQAKIVLEYNVIFTKESEGGYSASVPSLPGCHSQGDTFEETETSIKEAIELFLEESDAQLYHMTPAQSREQFIHSVQIQI